MNSHAGAHPGAGSRLGSTVQERHEQTGESPVRSHGGDEGAGASSRCRQAARAGAAQPGEEAAQGDLIRVCEDLKGDVKGDPVSSQ